MFISQLKSETPPPYRCTERILHTGRRRYLSSEYSGPFIHPPVAHRNIASVCIGYLSFICFNSNLPSLDIIASIKAGEYCLYEYAEQNWLSHVMTATKEDDQFLDSLIHQLIPFFKLRRNARTPHTSLHIPPTDRFHRFLKHSPEVHSYLNESSAYYCREFDLTNISRKLINLGWPIIDVCSHGYLQVRVP